MSIRKIPRVVYQTWETKDISPEFQNIIDSWKRYNPDYEYVLHDKYDREEYIRTNFHSRIYEAYCKIVPGAFKADLWRYCILYLNGGVYSDVDMLCMGKLDDFMKNDTEFMATIDLNTNPIEGKHNVANGFIACSQYHGIMKYCIYRLVYNIENNVIGRGMLNFSGPGLLGSQINKYLNRHEEDSIVGMEGWHGTIHLLNFEEHTEYMKDLNGNVLLQNKNGNTEIDRLYKIECEKARVISWLNTPALPQHTQSPPNSMYQQIQRRKSIALFIYGQFRSFRLNLENNLRAINDIIADNDVHVFILSDRRSDGNYSPENERAIVDILKAHNCIVHFIKYIEDIPEYDAHRENLIASNYYKISNSSPHYSTNEFVSRLMYRKYLINKLKNDYIRHNNLHIDLHVYCRLFDMVIHPNVDSYSIRENINGVYNQPNLILGSHDTFYIGSQESIDYIFGIGENLGLSILYNDEIWKNNDFVRHYSDIDYCLCMVKHTYSPEIQYAAHIFFSKYTYQNIRFDYNNENNVNNRKTLFHIKICQQRHNICNNKRKKIIPVERNDGFGAQFQTIIFTILFAEFNNMEYVHRDISEMAHNYNNDPEFIYKINNFMNIHGNYPNMSSLDSYNDVIYVPREEIYRHVEDNIDKYAGNNQVINKIKQCFWKNKDRNVYKNNKFNIAVHIRRENQCDDGDVCRVRPDIHFLNTMNNLRQFYKGKDVLFHIYSQGNIDSFDIYKNDDVVFHIDEDLYNTFIGLVGANALITSASSFSYVAALVTDAEVYYLPFWHKPKSNWVVI